MEQVLNEVIKELLKQVETTYKEHNKLTDELLSQLNFIFKTPLLSALDLIDRQKVTRISTPSKRELFQVIGSSGLLYLCFQSSNYCSCLAYRYSVLRKEEYPMCKHVLAARLSQAMGLCKEVQYLDKTLALMIANIE
ncbi:zinc finger SWIM domain-containing protein 7-like [Centruroides vittatus]|uniref:zinc finger SWIM domain-containing protein 7-like n=1 Tax=Centruroides vittatus TaxID=120091 RepID=UPI00350F99B7